MNKIKIYVDRNLTKVYSHYNEQDKLQGGFMKKSNFLFIFLAIILFLTILSGCSKKDTSTNTSPNIYDETSKYEDGIYFAEQDSFDEKSGWKSVVTIEVKDGKIIKVDWNEVNKNSGPDKKSLSMNGGYPIVERGNAKAPWHEQAEKVEMFLIETQDPDKINYTDEAGHTDAISGVTIKVNEFFELAKEALSKAK